MSTRSSVVDVAKDMQLVDDESLYDEADSADEVIGTTCRDDALDDDVDVGTLVVVVGVLMQQFLDDIRELFRERLAHL